MSLFISGEKHDWSDVTPVLQDDGPAPVAAMKYSAAYWELMDLFRTILASEGTDIRASFADMISDNEDTLRAVSTADFKYAMTKLKASVNDSGRELQKVIEWNSKYGETKNKQRSRRDVAMQMYI